MSEAVYVLKYSESALVLKFLNSKNYLDGGVAINRAINQRAMEHNGKGYPSLEKLEDWVAALKSGKKIVNPISPREMLKKFADKSTWTDDFIAGVEQAVACIALDPKHAEVADWLKDGEEDD